MKKIILCAMMTCLSFTLLPLQSNAATTTASNSLVVSRPAESKELQQRSDEKNAINGLNINPSASKSPQDRDMRSERHGRREMHGHGGVYFSVGGVLLIVLLVIILL